MYIYYFSVRFCYKHLLIVPFMMPVVVFCCWHVIVLYGIMSEFVKAVCAKSCTEHICLIMLYMHFYLLNVICYQLFQLLVLHCLEVYNDDDDDKFQYFYYFPIHRHLSTFESKRGNWHIWFHIENCAYISLSWIVI